MKVNVLTQTEDYCEIVPSPRLSGPPVSLGFVYRFAAVYGFGKPGKSAAAAAITLTTQGEMCTTKTKKLGVYVLE